MRREEQTPEQRAIYAERARERNRMKCRRRKAKRRAEQLAGTNAPGMSKTHPVYRRRLPPIPDMLMKSELRAFLAQAMRNTAEQVSQ